MHHGTYISCVTENPNTLNAITLDAFEPACGTATMKKVVVPVNKESGVTFKEAVNHTSEVRDPTSEIGKRTD